MQFVVKLYNPSYRGF